VEASLEQIKQLLVQQATLIGAQNDKITAQTQMIARLTAEVETLKKRVAGGAGLQQDQSERIRQLELELEAARS
jgi:coronin-1B/1C/6